MDVTTDINMLLSNAVKVFENESRLARLASDVAVAGIDDPLNKLDPHHQSRMRAEQQRQLEVAQIWDARAAEARLGFLLYGQNEFGDLGYQQTFRELIGKCRESGRLVYTRTIDAALAPSPRR